MPSIGADKAATRGVRGNAGLRDQELAMRFVQRNLAALRGQPGQVTVFGESAGAASIAFHLAANSSLFDRAILQSGVSSLSWAFVTASEAVSRADALTTAFSCPSARRDPVAAGLCLRSVPAEKLRVGDWISAGVFQFPWTPVVDNNYIKKHPSVQVG